MSSERTSRASNRTRTRALGNQNILEKCRGGMWRQKTKDNLALWPRRRSYAKADGRRVTLVIHATHDILEKHSDAQSPELRGLPNGRSIHNYSYQTNLRHHQCTAISFSASTATRLACQPVRIEGRSHKSGRLHSRGIRLNLEMPELLASSHALHSVASSRSSVQYLQERACIPSVDVRCREGEGRRTGVMLTPRRP
jgi:hypothetical protein